MSNDKTDFKVGDRVRYIADGDEGPIEVIDEDWITVNFETDGRTDVLRDEIKLALPGDPLAPWEKELLWTPFEQNVRRITNQIADLLLAKNKAYGDSALNPIRVFSKSDRIEQLNVRIDDKISRIQRGTDFEDEDTERDLIGYLILKLIAKETE